MPKDLIYTHTAPHLLWLAAAVLGLLVLAVCLELLRRRRERGKRMEAEWRAVRKIAKEKELTEEERKLLMGVLRRQAPQAPLRAVTIRQQFDACVDKEMVETVAQADARVVEKRGVQLRNLRTRLGLDYIPLGQRINSTRELYHGQVMWVARKEDAASEWRRMVVAWVDEAHFHLTLQEAGKAPGFKAGDELRCRMWREEDARYAFKVRVLRLEDQPPTWVFRHALRLERMQSRAHFRIRYEEAVNVGVLNAPRDGDMSDVDQRKVVTRLRGRTTSLSGGGLAVVVPQPVPKEVLLRLSLALDPEAEAIQVTVRPVATAPLSSGRHLVRGAFVGISDETRETITHFVFRMQQTQTTDSDPKSPGE